MKLLTLSLIHKFSRHSILERDRSDNERKITRSLFLGILLKLFLQNLNVASRYFSFDIEQYAESDPSVMLLM